MKYTVLMGSPRKNGNTAALLRAFMEENRDMGIEQDMIWLYDRTILPCLSCKQCQSTPWGTFGCPQEDDMQAIFDSVQTSEVLILASPIYSWYCTPPMKAVMDRLVPSYVNGDLFGALVESYCSEQNARMTAMKSSSDNARAMLQTLNLSYNRARQSAITQEITEVVGGAQAAL